MLELRNKNIATKRISACERPATLKAVYLIFCSEYVFGKKPSDPSELLDEHLEILSLVEKDLRDPHAAATRANALTRIIHENDVFSLYTLFFQ